MTSKRFDDTAWTNRPWCKECSIYSTYPGISFWIFPMYLVLYRYMMCNFEEPQQEAESIPNEAQRNRGSVCIKIPPTSKYNSTPLNTTLIRREIARLTDFSYARHIPQEYVLNLWRHRLCISLCVPLQRVSSTAWEQIARLLVTRHLKLTSETFAILELYFFGWFVIAVVHAKKERECSKKDFPV